MKHILLISSLWFLVSGLCLAAEAPVRTTRGARVQTTAPAPRAAATRGVAARTTVEAAATNVGRTANVAQRVTPRGGVSTRGATTDSLGRAVLGIRGGTQTTQKTVTARAGDITAVTEQLNAERELNNSCQQQYNDCMDQFCNVIDANQKRCTCSANLSKYAAVEKAAKDANVALNEVVGQIRYIGLSADEIRAILTATEAEMVLDRTTDTTETRDMLTTIEKLIQNPNMASNPTTGEMSTGFDLEFDLNASNDDMFNLDMFGGNSNSFANLRGTDLLNNAKNRCKSVLNSCRDIGANDKQIIANYELQVDKDCITYEQGLTKMNDQLKNNVRSATTMLQKARLAVLQNKNEFDAKGCVGALDKCMTDDMVCGGDYFKCIDPTKRYIDENGAVVLGQNIGNITRFMENYDNSQIDVNFIRNSTNATDSVENGAYIVKYLLSKIGTGKLATDGGMCRAVLDKCQRITYNDKEYNQFNDIVVNYIQRAMVQIKAAQSNIISEYASTCMADIATCYNQQVSQINAWSTTANKQNVVNVMKGACRNVSLTCAYAIFYTPFDEPENALCTTNNALNAQNTCIESVSKVFFQSMLCPANSDFESEGVASTEPLRVNEMCKCKNGYQPSNGECIECASSNTVVNGICKETPQVSE